MVATLTRHVAELSEFSPPSLTVVHPRVAFFNIRSQGLLTFHFSPFLLSFSIVPPGRQQQRATRSHILSLFPYFSRPAPVQGFHLANVDDSFTRYSHKHSSPSSRPATGTALPPGGLVDPIGSRFHPRASPFQGILLFQSFKFP